MTDNSKVQDEISKIEEARLLNAMLFAIYQVRWQYEDRADAQAKDAIAITTSLIQVLRQTSLAQAA